MISSSLNEYNSLVCEFSTRKQIPDKILELRKKIHQKEYLDTAISKIASVLSKELVSEPDELKYCEK